MKTDISFLTTFVILTFSFFYLLYLFYISSQRKLDFYDTIFLSLVSIVPAIFIISPNISYYLNQFFNIKNTFSIWFGLLIAVGYILIIRLSIKVHEINKLNINLTQEISILIQEKNKK